MNSHARAWAVCRPAQPDAHVVHEIHQTQIPSVPASADRDPNGRTLNLNSQPINHPRRHVACRAHRNNLGAGASQGRHHPALPDVVVAITTVKGRKQRVA
ncbi:MAG: hypothetical protein L0Z50_01135 [Verrucomicrobiales bacterium]|nr:hypothetical protein [Verrucomicrobiales bacterium]